MIQTLIYFIFIFFLIVQILRYKIIYELGKYWTTRILVINQPLIQTWMFRYLRHPNYIVVFLEVILICLFFDDLLSLVIFFNHKLDINLYPSYV